MYDVDVQLIRNSLGTAYKKLLLTLRQSMIQDTYPMD
jgi:hypothetical protein